MITTLSFGSGFLVVIHEPQIRFEASADQPLSHHFVHSTSSHPLCDLAASALKDLSTKGRASLQEVGLQSLNSPAARGRLAWQIHSLLLLENILKRLFPVCIVTMERERGDPVDAAWLSGHGAEGYG